MERADMQKKKQPDIDKIEKEVSPAQYREMLKHLELRDVYLKEVNSILYSKEIEKSAKLNFKESFHIIQLNKEDALLQADYEINAKSGKRNIFKIRAKYDIFFEMTESLPEEFFLLYSRHSMPLQTYPYFRELVNSIISRMGLPPLVLGLRKFLVGQPEN